MELPDYVKNIQLSQDLQLVIKSCFEAIDSNSDRSLSFYEINDFLISHDISGDFSPLIFRLMGGQDRMSKVTFDGFTGFFKILEAINDPSGKGKTAGFETLFNSIDTDKSGAIDFNEMKSYLNLLGIYFTDEEISKIYKDLDENKDNSISLQEFLEFVK